jgi:hypothetical protein
MNVDDKALGASTQHFYIASRNGNNDNNNGMIMTNVDDKALCTSARRFHIALRNGNSNNNYGNDDDEC